jgi:hypothetical protein
MSYKQDASGKIKVLSEASSNNEGLGLNTL